MRSTPLRESTGLVLTRRLRRACERIHELCHMSGRTATRIRFTRYRTNALDRLPGRPSGHAPVDSTRIDSARADIACLARAHVSPARQECYNPPKLIDQAQDP